MAPTRSARHAVWSWRLTCNALLVSCLTLPGGCPDSTSAGSGPSTTDSSGATPSDSAAQVPAKPDGLALSSGDGQVTLTWGTVTDATGYRVRYRTVDQDWVEVDVTTASLTQEPLVNGHWYCYEVVAYNAAGASEAAGAGCTIPQPSLLRTPVSDALVSVSDANLREYIRGLADQFGYQYTNDLTELSIANSEERTAIRDLTGIGQFNALSKLTLTGHKIVNWSPLADLTRLTELTLERNDIIDVGPLGDLTGLINLNLANNEIENVGALPQRLIYLVWLNLASNRIDEFGQFSGYRGRELILDSQNVGGAGPYHVESLVTITTLEHLSLRSNPGLSCEGLQAVFDAFGSTRVEAQDPGGACGNQPTLGCNCR